MNELYEFAKQVDAIVIFFLIYGLVIGGFVNMLMECLHWGWKKWNAFREKKKKEKEDNTAE